MQSIQQGDLLKVSGLPYPVMVVSNNLFNSEGKAIVCPIINDVKEGPLHIRLKDSPVDGYVLCEQLKYVDLQSRRFSRLSAANYFDIMNISDAVMGVFEYL